MQADQVKADVRRYIEENFFLGAAGSEALADDASFLEHHVLDSTGFLELIAHLEERFEIRVADDEMTPENLDSIAAVATYVLRKRP